MIKLNIDKHKYELIMLLCISIPLVILIEMFLVWFLSRIGFVIGILLFILINAIIISIIIEMMYEEGIIKFKKKN